MTFNFFLLTLFSAHLSAVQITLPDGTVSEMISYEVPGRNVKEAPSSNKLFFIDKNPVTQKIYRAFDPTYIQRLKSLCDDCPVAGVTESEKENFCGWAGKRTPTAGELKTAVANKEKNFRCAADDKHIKALRRPKKSKPVVSKYTTENMFKGGACDPVLE